MKSTNTPPRLRDFNYKSIDAALAKELRRSAERVRECMRRSIAGMGRELSSVRLKLDHGKWGPWLAREFNFSERTAQRIIRAYELIEEYGVTENISDTALYALSAPSTPDAVREETLGRIKGGACLTIRQIMDEISGTKQGSDGRQADANPSKATPPDKMGGPASPVEPRARKRRLTITKEARKAIESRSIEKGDMDLYARVRLKEDRIVIRSIVTNVPQPDASPKQVKAALAKDDW